VKKYFFIFKYEGNEDSVKEVNDEPTVKNKIVYHNC